MRAACGMSGGHLTRALASVEVLEAAACVTVRWRLLPSGRLLGPRRRRTPRCRWKARGSGDRYLIDKTHAHLTYDATERNVSLEHYNAQTQRPEAGACGVSRLTSTAPTHSEVRS